MERFKGIHIGVPSTSWVPVPLRPQEVGGASERWEGRPRLPSPHSSSLLHSNSCGKSLRASDESARREPLPPSLPPPQSSALVLDFSDGWNQTTGGFVLVDLVGHVGAHGLDLNVPGVGIFWFICKPFLFCRGHNKKKEDKRCAR